MSEIEADAPSDILLAEIERNAVDLARLAGTEIQASLGRTMSVRYKEGQDEATLYRDPVSEVDHRCETMIRARLDELLSRHRRRWVSRLRAGQSFRW